MKKLLTFLLLITAFTSSAQIYQRDPSQPGRSIDRYQVLKALHIPTTSGVPNLSDDVITNTSAIAYDSAGHKFYVYDPSTETWGQVTGGGIVIDPGVDSITYHNNQLCQWVSGVSTCYFLNKFYDSTALNFDSTKILHFNSGNLVDSVLIPTGTIHIIQDGAGETNIVRVEDSTRLHFPTLKNTDDITISKASDSAVLLQFTHPHYTKDQIDSIKATITAEGITRAELIDTANNKVNKTDVSGGTINQVLKKNSATDYDWSWQDESGGVAQSVISDTLKNYANSGSITTDNVVYSTPIALSVANHLMTGALALKSQSAYSLFGRGSGSGSPSFLSAIDSNWVSGLHTENYYKTLFKPIGATTSVDTAVNYTWLGKHTFKNSIIGTGDAMVISPTLTASANNQILTGLYVNPTFSIGSFTGVTSNAMSVNGGIYASGDANNASFLVANSKKIVANAASNGTMYIDASLNTSGTINLRATTINLTGAVSLANAVNNGTFTINGGGSTFLRNNSTGVNGIQINNTTSGSLWDIDVNRNGVGDFEISLNTGNPKITGLTSGSWGFNNATPNASAQIDMTSITKGFLPPRMTKTQRNAIASPAAGLMVIVIGETGGEYLSWYNSSTSGWVKVTSTAD